MERRGGGRYVVVLVGGFMVGAGVRFCGGWWMVDEIFDDFGGEHCWFVRRESWRGNRFSF